MKLIAPDYYSAFTCIADRCNHSCCIGWEIDIDEETLETYRSVDGDFGKRLRDGIMEEDGTAHFQLCENERCPFLNERGLCDIILTLGEDALSQICTDHPRFCSFFGNRTEIGLGFCCEEVCRLILSQKEKTELVILEDDGEDDELTQEETDLLIFREKLLTLAQNREKTLDARMADMLSLAGEKLPEKSISEWIDFYLGLERMDAAWTTLLEKARNSSIHTRFLDEIPFEQLLVYFIYRHLSDVDRRAGAVSFAVLSVKMIRFLCEATAADRESMIEICRLYSSEIEYSEENTEILKSKIK